MYTTVTLFFFSFPLSFALSGISPFINPITLSKIRIFGADYHEELHSVIDREVLEQAYGGENDYKYDHNAWLAEHGIVPSDD
jgi:hypothetical protein